ncbi:low-temperature-induced cysteine proteinase-like [Nymphaea colorata]|nr:low-temperature-induced cysteine proteinase-like [Nymphaea colorata]
MASRAMVLLLVCLVSASACIAALDMSIMSYNEENPNGRTDLEVTQMFEDWMAIHGKSYSDVTEKEKRFKIFKDNLLYIDRHNVGDHSYELGLNQFSDLTNDEYRSIYLHPKVEENKLRSPSPSQRYEVQEGEELPEWIDWRDLGVVAEVKDQGQCGSCWAFSAIAAVEGVNKIVTDELITLSEQELVDCDTTYSQGCNGGYTDYAFEFIINNGGIDTDNDYCYKGVNGVCDVAKKNTRVVTIDGYEYAPLYNEEALKKAVAHQPVSVYIEGSGRDFQNYKYGVFTGSCGTNTDHAVVIVGYGSENGLDYWIVRNSWGKCWGEGGYIRMQRNVPGTTAGMCGIATYPCYPTKEPMPTICDDYSRCPPSSTCCCMVEAEGKCTQWGCCPLESATCCEDHRTCCPHDYPVCNVAQHACYKNNNIPFGVKAHERTPAKPLEACDVAQHGSSSIASA